MAGLPLPPGVPGGRTNGLASRLNSAAVRLVRRIARDDGRDGLTRARASALSVLVYGGPRTMTALARAEMVTGPTMTRVVQGLVRAGLARRSTSPDDGRRIVLAASAKGKRLLERARARRILRLAAELKSLASSDLTVLEAAALILARLEHPRKEEP